MLKTTFSSQSLSNNNEYFKGRVKSVYEKEPMFKDFLRNLSLTEQNNYENKNLTTLKKRFNKMVQDKHGLDNSSKHDPLIPSRVRITQWGLVSVFILWSPCKLLYILESLLCLRTKKQLFSTEAEAQATSSSSSNSSSSSYLSQTIQRIKLQHLSHFKFGEI